MRLFVLCAVWVLSCGSAANAFASDPPGTDARTALRHRAFPWYDAGRDGFRPVRPESPPTQFREPSFSLPFVQILLWTLLGVVVALIVVALFNWLRNARTIDDPVATPTAVATVSLQRLEALPETTRGVRDLLGEAARLAAESAYGQAMTFYHSWQLMQLDKHGWLELQKGKTNRQYLAEVTASCPDLADPFRLSTRLFEDAFFGHLEVRKEQFEQVWSQRGAFESTSRRLRS